MCAPPDRLISSPNESSTSNVRFYRFLTLCLLCLSDGTYTVLRRYSRGVLKQTYSAKTCLLLAEVIKTVFSAVMVRRRRIASSSSGVTSLLPHFLRLLATSRKMLILSAMYLSGNVLSYYALERIGAGTFAVIAQGKTFTTAMFAVLIMGRSFSYARWRAMVTQVAGVVLFVLPTLDMPAKSGDGGGAVLGGIMAEIAVITISGGASIYFEMIIKSDPTDIWERNFQLGFSSIAMYSVLGMWTQNPSEAEDGTNGSFLSGWTSLATILSILGASGGLLVALSIKYGDSVLKTLAISGSIIFASVIDRIFLKGPLNLQMVLAAIVVITSIIDYTFDPTPPEEDSMAKKHEDGYNGQSGTKSAVDGRWSQDLERGDDNSDGDSK